MKKRSVFGLLLAFVLLISLLTGCGGAKSSSNAMAWDEAAEAPGMMEEDSFSADSSGITLPENRKLIRTVHMEAQTQDMDALLTGTEQLVHPVDTWVGAAQVGLHSRLVNSLILYQGLCIFLGAHHLGDVVGVA